MPPLDITEELCLELGRFLIAANSLESSIFELYVGLTAEPREDVVHRARGWTLGVLVNAFVAVFRQHVRAGQHLEAFDRLEPRLRAAVDRRNEYVHASWWLAEDQRGHERYRRPRAGGEELARRSPEEVFSSTHDLWRLADELAWLTNELAESGVRNVQGYEGPPESENHT
jgi:hypothetical protein